MNIEPQIHIFADEDILAEAAARHFVDRAAQSIAARGSFMVALSGGSTPRRMYEHLAEPSNADRVEWSRVELFWGDERAVPPNDAESNYRMAAETLLGKIRIPGVNIHRMQGELDAAEAARLYERELALAFRAMPPRFDLLLLGLGENGHIASLFPHTDSLHERDHAVIGMYVEEVGMSRISLTLPAINHAEEILFVVAGKAKAEVVERVLQGPVDTATTPAQAVKPGHGALLWFIDESAATGLRRA